MDSCHSSPVQLEAGPPDTVIWDGRAQDWYRHRLGYILESLGPVPPSLTLSRHRHAFQLIPLTMSSGDRKHHFRRPSFAFLMYLCPSNSPHDSTWLSYEKGHMDSFSRSVGQTKEVTVSLNVHTSLNYDFPLCCPEVPGFPCGWEFGSFLQREPEFRPSHLVASTVSHWAISLALNVCFVSRLFHLLTLKLILDTNKFMFAFLPFVIHNQCLFYFSVSLLL